MQIVSKLPHETNKKAQRVYLTDQVSFTIKQEKIIKDNSWLLVLLVGLYVLAVAAYISLRFSWNWLPNDAVHLTSLSQHLIDEKTLAPTAGAYPYGYGYPTLNAVIARLSGLPISAIQKYIQPFLTILLAPIAFAAFKSLLGNSRGAALATFLMFMQTEFVFEAMRGSHAKLTWIFALSMLFSLARSFQSRNRIQEMAAWVPIFYLSAYGLIASNSFFGSQFVFGIVFAFVGWFLLSRWLHLKLSNVRRLDRLFYVVIACSILFFLYYFYLYPPALGQLSTLERITDKLATFFLDVETGAHPYAYIQKVWVNRWVYPLLMALNWIVLLLSLAAWGRRTITFLKVKTSIHPQQLLLWLLYMAFALLLGISVILDLAGVLSANMQLRVFPNFMIFAILMAADLLVEFFAKVRSWNPQVRTVVRISIAACFVFFSMASILKVTNEPYLNNYWLFQTTQERQALTWMEDDLADTTVWLGFDQRLSGLLTLYERWKTNELVDVVGDTPEDGRYLLVSSPMEVLAARMKRAMPNVRSDLKVYDNGGAAVYHTRPKTPYQR